MKIEIELSEVEALKQQIRRLSEEKKELEGNLKILDESELIKKAVELSKILLDKYMRCIFKKLGFDNDKESWGYSAVSFSDNLEYWISHDWYDRPEEIEVTLGANISQKWANAFLLMGISREKEEEESGHKL